MMSTLRIILVELTISENLSQFWTFMESCLPENLEHVVVLGNIGSGIRLVSYEEMILRLENIGEIMYAEVKVEKDYNTLEIMGVIANSNIERAL